MPGKPLSLASARVRPRLVVVTAVIAICLAGALLRCLAARGDLWFDEVISHQIAMRVPSLGEILHVRIDNNHLLNTMLMRLIGEREYDFAYRLPSIIAGIGTVVLGGWIGRRWGTCAAIAIMIAFALSHPLVHYGSEARGYSLACFFALASVAALDCYMRAPRFGVAALFWISTIGGILANATFAMVYLALAAWSLHHFWKFSVKTITACRQSLVLHAVPIAIGAYLTIAFLARLHIAGGHEAPITLVIGRAAAMMFGAAEPSNSWLVPMTLAALVLFIAGIWWLRRIADGIWLFFTMVIVVAPVLLLVASQPKYVYERYFLLAIMFLLMLMVALLARLIMSHDRRLKMTASAILALILVANAWQIMNLIRFGRGNYSQAISFIIRNTPADQAITIASDHDSRNKPLVRYHSHGLQRTIDYFDNADGAPPPTRWYIVHRFHGDPPVQNILAPGGDRTYELIRAFDYASLSGWQWLLYRQVASHKHGKEHS
jgi:hypothetical protein